MKYTSSILALQFCIILSFSSYYCQSRFTNEIRILKNYFNADNSDVGDNGTLFVGILKNCQEESERKIFQSQIVSFYFKLFEKHFTDNQTVQNSMNTIKEQIITKFFKDNSSNKVQAFKNLIQISVNDEHVQRQAIIELKKVIDDLSPNQRKRRRTQMLFQSRRASK
ncbi:interferon gamma precursor [Cavia porcellus]|uniref:Interferon gamma n=2 Tax=Cavia porcellus TaxID=10141 RepID=Q8CGS0_CAVPO|nr:interferon gamma precursor [Cavia porcellus]AAN75515.1 interferon-gamma [Cavia porcellus]CAB0000259.1 TPA: interferon 2F [Cavia porcellus]